MKKICLLLIGVLPFFAYAQYEVHLKNGKIVTGKLISIREDNAVIIQTEDGNKLYHPDEILTRGISDKPSSASDIRYRHGHAEIYNTGKSHVKDQSGALTWYGIDISRVRLIEAKRLDQKEKFYNVYREAILAYFDKRGWNEKTAHGMGAGNLRQDEVKADLLEGNRAQQCVSIRLNEFDMDTIGASIPHIW